MTDSFIEGIDFLEKTFQERLDLFNRMVEQMKEYKAYPPRNISEIEQCVLRGDYVFKNDQYHSGLNLFVGSKDNDANYWLLVMPLFYK